MVFKFRWNRVIWHCTPNWIKNILTLALSTASVLSVGYIWVKFRFSLMCLFSLLENFIYWKFEVPQVSKHSRYPRYTFLNFPFSHLSISWLFPPSSTAGSSCQAAGPWCFCRFYLPHPRILIWMSNKLLL